MSSLDFVLEGSLVTSKSTCGRVLINIELKKKSVPSKPTSCRSCQVAAATVPLSHHTVNIVDVDYIQNDEHQLLSLFSKILMIHPLIKQGTVPLSVTMQAVAMKSTSTRWASTAITIFENVDLVVDDQASQKDSVDWALSYSITSHSTQCRWRLHPRWAPLPTWGSCFAMFIKI